jgi:hypothetical protein
MSCALTAGYAIECQDTLGGVDIVYIAKHSDMTVAESSGTVTGITKASGTKFWKFEVPQATAEGKDTGEYNRENGTMVFNHAVTLPLNKRDAATRNIIMALFRVGRVLIVVKEMTGRYTMYGKDFGLWLTAPEGSTGVTGTDRNGYNLTFEGQQREAVLEVNSTVGAALETEG